MQSEIAALTEQRARAAARVEEIQRDIDKLTVTAPRAGTVIYYSDRGGEKKKVGDQVWRGAQVLEIPDLSRMLADGEVDEADAGRLSVGQRVTLRLDAHPEVEYTGRIDRIGRTVQQRSRRSPIKVVKIEIELDETDAQRMRPGMRFRGEVEIDRRDDILVLPPEAVLMTADGPVVRRRSGFGVGLGPGFETVRPTLGLRADDGVEVLEGLAEGDEVSLRPAEVGS
jgi:multidrug resistance efflux pump